MNYLEFAFSLIYSYDILHKYMIFLLKFAYFLSFAQVFRMEIRFTHYMRSRCIACIVPECPLSVSPFRSKTYNSTALIARPNSAISEGLLDGTFELGVATSVKHDLVTKQLTFTTSNKIYYPTL